jgi:hypothetical protein
MGITWRPDLLTREIATIDDFLAQVDAEHPAIGELVRSGEVLDTQRYRNYLYRAERVYSSDRWFLVGDAARSVDPLYSTGLSMTVMQIEQITEMIRRMRGPGIAAEQVDDLQGLWNLVADLRQQDISDQYATMNDPFQACMRRYWNLCGWFNGVLPLWYCGYFCDPAAARVLRRFFAAGIPRSRSAWRLFSRTARALGPVEQAHFDRVLDFDWLINRAFDRPASEVGRELGGLLYKRARLRLNLVRLGGWRELPDQALQLVAELALAGLVPVVFSRHPALRDAHRPRELEPRTEAIPA